MDQSVRPKVRFTKPKESEELLSKPLEKKRISFVNAALGTDELPALHSQFAESLVYLKYRPPPLESSGSTSVKAWFEDTLLLESNLRIILRLPHHRFWSTVIYRKGFHISLDSYLKNSPRYFDFQSLLLTEEMKFALNRLNALVFRILLRMSTRAESAFDYIRKETFGQLIYDHYVFDVPRILDICVLYGSKPSIHKFVRELLINVFNSSSKFENDLCTAAEAIRSGFNQALAQMGISLTTSNSQHIIASRLSEMGLRELQNLDLFLVELSVSMSSLLLLYPDCAKHFRAANFVPTFFESVFNALFPPLKMEFQRRSESVSFAVSVRIKLQVCLIRASFLDSFHRMVETLYVQPLKSRDLNEESKALLKSEFLDLLSSMDISGDFAIARKRFLIEDELNLPLPKALPPSTPTDTQLVLTEQEGPPDATSSAAVEMGNAELESYMSSVSDILPHVDREMVKMFLYELEFNVEKVIDMLLSGRIPERLRSPVPVARPQEIQVPVSEVETGDKKNKEAVLRLAKLQELEEAAAIAATDREYDDEYDDTYEMEPAIERKRIMVAEERRTSEEPTTDKPEEQRSKPRLTADSRKNRHFGGQNKSRNNRFR